MGLATIGSRDHANHLLGVVCRLDREGRSATEDGHRDRVGLSGARLESLDISGPCPPAGSAITRQHRLARVNVGRELRNAMQHLIGAPGRRLMCEACAHRQGGRPVSIHIEWGERMEEMRSPSTRLAIKGAQRSDLPGIRWLLAMKRMPSDDITANALELFLVCRDAVGVIGVVGLERRGGCRTPLAGGRRSVRRARVCADAW